MNDSLVINKIVSFLLNGTVLSSFCIFEAISKHYFLIVDGLKIYQFFYYEFNLLQLRLRNFKIEFEEKFYYLSKNMLKYTAIKYHIFAENLFRITK